jgi:hypothetical protein
MSSDGKEPGATWQNPQQWNRPVEHTQSFDADGLTPEVHQPQVQDAQPVDELPFTDGEMGNGYGEEYPYADSEQFGEATAASNPSELLHQLWHYFTLILAPLLFGGLTCLFVLPLIATGRAQVPSTALWPMALIIALIAIAQGVAVYYAGTNNGMWALGTVGGFFLFLLVGCFAIFGPLLGVTLLVVLIAASVYLARYYIRSVAQGTVDIVYAFGKYTRTLYYGPNIVFPWEKVVQTLNTRVTQWTCPAQRVQLSRSEDVIMRAEISYQLLPEDANLAVTQVQNWEESLHHLLATAIQTIATSFTPDDILPWPQGMHAQRASYRDQHGMPGTGARWEQINTALSQYMRDKVALWGVQVNWVKMRDVSLVPHDAVVLNTDPVMHIQSNESNPASGGAAAGKQAKAAADETTKKLSEPAVMQQPATLASEGATNGVGPNGIPKNILKEDLLIRAYKEVQSGKITDPATIRSIAQKFDAVAQDPELNQNVSFDPVRAAQNLYAQAKRCEEVYEAGIFNDETKPDWLVRRPTDENLTGGG